VTVAPASSRRISGTGFQPMDIASILTMNPVIQDHSDALRGLCRKFGVRRLDVFGSAANGDFDPSRSDVDFLVEFDPAPLGKRADQYFGMLFDLQRLFGRKVDLVEVGAVSNPYVLKSIEASRVPFYVAA
jgi:predicted nucleotidyltransferase